MSKIYLRCSAGDWTLHDALCVLWKWNLCNYMEWHIRQSKIFWCTADEWRNTFCATSLWCTKKIFEMNVKKCLCRWFSTNSIVCEDGSMYAWMIVTLHAKTTDQILMKGLQIGYYLDKRNSSIFYTGCKIPWNKLVSLILAYNYKLCIILSDTGYIIRVFSRAYIVFTRLGR